MMPDFINPDEMLRLAINTVAKTVPVLGMSCLCPRRQGPGHRRVAGQHFAFGVLSILGSVAFSLAAGFGLFVILALFTLPSEQISKIEITCFFGSISLVVICFIQRLTLSFVGVVLGLPPPGARVFDHPHILNSADGLQVKVERTDPDALPDPGQAAQRIVVTAGGFR